MSHTCSQIFRPFDERLFDKHTDLRFLINQRVADHPIKRQRKRSCFRKWGPHRKTAQRLLRAMMNMGRRVMVLCSVNRFSSWFSLSMDAGPSICQAVGTIEPGNWLGQSCQGRGWKQHTEITQSHAIAELTLPHSSQAIRRRRFPFICKRTI